jgi:hypothetical protein
MTMTPYDRAAQDAVLLELSHLPRSWGVVRQRPDGAVTALVAQLHDEGHARAVAAGRADAVVVYVDHAGRVG